MTRPLAAALVVIIVKQHRPLRRQPTQIFPPHTLRTTATHRDHARETARASAVAVSVAASSPRDTTLDAFPTQPVVGLQLQSPLANVPLG